MRIESADCTIIKANKLHPLAIKARDYVIKQCKHKVTQSVGTINSTAWLLLAKEVRRLKLTKKDNLQEALKL